MQQLDRRRPAPGQAIAGQGTGEQGEDGLEGGHGLDTPDSRGGFHRPAGGLRAAPVKPAGPPPGINDVSDGGAPLSDAGIVTAVAAGGRDAVLSALLPAWKRKVHALAWSIVHDAATADDVTQEVFVRVWRALPSYDGRARFSTWLYTITRNTALNARRGRRPQLSLSDATTFAEAELALERETHASTRSDAAADATEGALRSRAIAAALAELPERQQQVVALFYLQDRSHEEVAAMLAMPLGTVKTLLHRARARLAQRLGAHAPGESP